MSSRSFGSRIDARSGKADVGFGSFYNHFSTKSEPFEAAVADVLEELGELFDRLSVDVEDAATAFAQSVRLMLRLCRSRPQISAVLVWEGMHYMEFEGGVAPRQLRDIRAGVASGRFLKAEPRLARAAVSGAALATLQMSLHAEHPAWKQDCGAERVVGLGKPRIDAHHPTEPLSMSNPVMVRLRGSSAQN